MPVVEDPVAVRAVPEPDRLPTLTEVVQLASDPWAAAAWAASAAQSVQSTPAPATLAEGFDSQVQPDPIQPAREPEPPESPVPTLLLAEVIDTPTDIPSALPAAPVAAAEPMTVAPGPVRDEDQITLEVLAALEQRLDGLFEARLREALAPALARAADGLIRDLRPELTQALHDLVHDAVTRALQETPPR
jgi:hypothetical protein